MSWIVNRSTTRDRQRQLCGFIDSQTVDEFEIMAKERGTTKAGLLRELVEREVSSALRTNSIGGSNARHRQPA